VIVALPAAAAGMAAVPWLASAAYAHRFIRPLDDLPHADVALVPGAYIMRSGEPGPHLTARLELALAALRAGAVPTIVVSGGHPAGGRDEPAAMRRWLLRHGVADAQIIPDDGGLTTYASLRRARDIFGTTSVVICSQRYHLPRAVTTARLLGLTAWGLGEDDVWRDHPRTSRRGLLREIGAAWKMLRDVARHRL